MVKSVLGVNHQGLSDWMIQRVSAIFMAIYTLGLLYYVVFHHVTYTEWHALFSLGLMKIASILFLVLLLYHAWIGMWTIFTDYVKPFKIRAVLDVLVLFLLFACFIWGVMILWSV